MLMRRKYPKYNNRHALALSDNWNAPSGFASELDEFFANLFGLIDRSNSSFSPPINVSENDTDLQITAELPGLTEEDIEISIVDNELTLKGEKKQEWESHDGNTYRAERTYGSFCRTVRLEADLYDFDKADAVFKNGVLKLTVPKMEAVQISKRIAVKSE